MPPPPAYVELENRLAEIHDIGRARALLAWDERTMMPPGGAAARAEQLATLARVLHERLVSDQVARLLEELGSYEQELPYDSDEASLIRVARREHERARRVPIELKVEIARASSIGEHAWEEARARSDFALFLPYLRKNVELELRYVECFDAQRPYDPLLDDFEPGMTTAEAERLLGELKEAILPLAAAIAERAGSVDDSCLHGSFAVERQRELVLGILEELPIAPDAWRLDGSAHPFSTSFSVNDVRITTRYSEDYLASALFSALHELGHGLYDNGVDSTLDRSALSHPASLGVHESQSRLWENMVGRGLPFWRHFYPRLKALFPDSFASVQLRDFHRAVNKVQPSLIRTEADEVTYNLHIILRFELEQEILQGGFELRELPEAWNARMKSYLGLDVPDDADGVLQDVHWAEGSFGYFPTYSIGNIISGQLWEALREQIPDLDDQIERGELGALREWLRQNVHRHGGKFTSAEMIERVTGGPIEVGPYVRYLKQKMGEIYALQI
jgi:carboxypeptidase Taq